jgi:endonuclease/exonuclease/phosphatase (EEP) superfamily protein YafD
MLKNEPAILKVVTFLIISLSLLVAIASVMGYFFGDVWLFDFLSSFLFQFSCILLFCAVVLFILDAKVFAIIALVSCFFVSIPVYSVYISFFVGENQPLVHREAQRVFFSNAQFGNTDYDAILGQIRKNDPDVIVIAEGKREMFTALEERLIRYEYGEFFEGSEAFDMFYFSKKEPAEVEEIFFASETIPSIVLTFTEPRVYSIIATHPVPPLSPQTFDERNAQLEKVAEKAQSISHPVVVVGDLNTSAWSVHFRKLLSEGGLFDARNGSGIHLSWPIRYAGFEPIIAPFRIPIDHALYSADVSDVKKMQGGDIGSDHRPVILEFGL